MAALTSPAPTALPQVLPKVLIVTTVHWPATTRLALALAKAGFAVAAVAPAAHGLHKLDAVDVAVACSPHLGLATTVRRVIEQWSPDLVIPGDDRALACLHRLYATASVANDRRTARLRRLIEASLGDPRHFAAIERKSAFVKLAVAEGLRVPHTVVVRDVRELRRHVAAATFPQVLKIDGSWGGEGVRIVHGPAEAEQAFCDLALPANWMRIAKSIAQNLNFTPLADRLYGRAPTVTLQAYVEGRPANRAVACWRGEVLAGLSVEVVQTSGATGPASVVRIIDHPELAEATRRLVRRLGLSGFCGLDVILDSSGRAHAVELNARTTQICHLALDEASDMIGTLHATMTQQEPRRVTPVKHDVITFFPQELWRDRQSKYLASAYHDVPWDEPQFIAAYLQPDQPGWIDQLRLAWGRAPRLDTETALGGVPMAPSRPITTKSGT